MPSSPRKVLALERGELISVSEAAGLLGLQSRTLSRMRQRDVLISGIHYVQRGATGDSGTRFEYFAEAIRHYKYNSFDVHREWVIETGRVLGIHVPADYLLVSGGVK